MDGKKAVGRNVVIALGIMCVILAVGLVGAVTHYTLIINGKDDIIASLNSRIGTLTDQKARLQVWLEGNLSKINELNAQMVELRNEVSALSLQKSQLQRWLQENITYYNSRISSLNAEIEKLQYQMGSLNAQITALNGQVASLEAQYQSYVDAYQNLRVKVNERWDRSNVESFITYRDQAVYSIVYSITGGWSNPSNWNEFWDDIKAMYSWVVNNIEYRYDGLYPILPPNPSGSLDFCDEMWQFPNETLSLRKGDCEDQAILLCSMIRCYTNGQYNVEVIIIESGKAGHAAVQIPVSGDKLVILDPAGKYYSHDFWGNIAPNNITVEINNWLNYWKPRMGNDVHVSRVFSDYVDKSFASTNEYIKWMYSR